jgi:polyisoprenoid-binding protein YceI
MSRSRPTGTDPVHRPSPDVSLRWCALWIAIALRPALAAETYVMDATHCIPTFEFTHLGMTTQTGRFDRAQGQIMLDRASHRGSVRYEIDAASLNLGFGTERPDSPGYQLFEVTKFPTIGFRSDNFYFDDHDRVIAAQGYLTLLGVTRPVTVWVSHFACAVSPLNRKHLCSGNVAATINRSEFGMTKFIPSISDQVNIKVPIEAYRE